MGAETVSRHADAAKINLAEVATSFALFRRQGVDDEADVFRARLQLARVHCAEQTPGAGDRAVAPRMLEVHHGEACVRPLFDPRPASVERAPQPVAEEDQGSLLDPIRKTDPYRDFTIASIG